MPAWYKATAKLFLRVSLAAVFLIHGAMKLSAWKNPDAGTLMKTLFVVETLGGALVLLGLWTRWAAAALAVVMLGAIHAKIAQMGVGFMGGQGAGWEFDLVNLAGAVVLTAIGAGRYSIDAFLCSCGVSKPVKQETKPAKTVKKKK